MQMDFPTPYFPSDANFMPVSEAIMQLKAHLQKK